MEQNAEARRRRPPSKVRYDRKHPVLGTRVPRADYDAVKAYLAKTGMSYAKFIRLALQREKRDYSDAHEAGFNEGVDAGFKEAQETFAVVYECSVCGGEITLKSEEEKRSAAERMTYAGWHHRKCPSMSS